MIYLTDYRCASSSDVTTLTDIKYPQSVHWFPETYSKTKTGLFYPPHLTANKVLDADLATALREDTEARTAFILASGNANFAGIVQIGRAHV